MTIRFMIPGAPCGKGRPKFSTASGFARAYTPEKTINYENLVKMAFQQAGGEPFGAETPVGMRIIAHYQIPKSASKKKQRGMIEGTARPLVKPDADNVCKIVCDALNGIAYHDDTQVVYLEFNKRYGEEPRVEVEMWEM